MILVTSKLIRFFDILSKLWEVVRGPFVNQLRKIKEFVTKINCHFVSFQAISYLIPCLKFKHLEDLNMDNIGRRKPQS